MIQINKKEECCGCEACINICPVKCISMEYDEEGFRYPKVDKKKCINCHLCEKTCPLLNKYKSNQKGYLVYGATNKNKKTLKESTSGGVFYELAKEIINQNGIVFGVKYDKDELAIFDYAEDLEKLKQFMGSKYLQAKVNGMYIKAKENLEKGRLVLFSGTPCQIAGLYSFLGKKYENLYTLDLVCEGVPSEIIFNAFKNHYEKKYNSKIVDIKFRNKKYGWKYFGFLITFDNGKKIYIPRNEISFLAFLFGLTMMRPSCYKCHFRELKSGSDFKLADFWEVNNSQETKYNFYGVSHLLINNKKAEQLFEKVKKNFELYNSTTDEIKKLNHTFRSQVFSNDEKLKFLEKIKGKSKEDIYEIMNEYLNLNILSKIKFRIKLKLVKIKYAIKTK